MRRLPLRLVLLLVILVSWLVAAAAGLHGLERSTWYLTATSALLAIGLFASTSGIDLAAAREHRGLIVAAITIGVLVKAVLIGGVLWAVTGNPVFIVLGVAVAQIDPLSVVALQTGGRLSDRARAILNAWASFDDPATVLLTVYAVAIAAGVGVPGFDGAVGDGLSAYGLQLALNFGLALVAYVTWRWLRRWPVVVTAVLTILAAVAVWQFLMLAVAIAGLFIRPAWLVRVLPAVTNTALLLAGGLLGLLLVGGVQLGYGLALGAMAFLAQVVVGALLTRGLPPADRVHLALAQQNGITAIILALRLEVSYVGAVAIIAPAILVTNLIYAGANWLADRRRPDQVAAQT